MNQIYYSVDQISKLLDMHPKTIQRYIREGKLRATKFGKSYRVSGQDLSIFTEQSIPSNQDVSPTMNKKVVASSVIDIFDLDRHEAMRIMNTLTATLNVKPDSYGQTSMQSQYIEQEQKVRVTLWGNTTFMAVMMDTIAALTESEIEDH